MKSFVKFLISGIIVIVIGIVVLLIGLGIDGWNVNPEFTEQIYMQNIEKIETVSLEIASGEFETVFYDGDKIEIEYYTSNVKKTTITESGNTLYFREKSKLWISFGSVKYPKTVVKLPKDNVYDLQVDMSAGVVSIASGAYGIMILKMSAGKINLGDDIKCKSLRVNASAGKIEANSIDCSSGISFFHVSAGQVDIDHLKCPVINIDVSAGSVNLGIDGVKAEYLIKVDKSAGSCNVQNQTVTAPLKILNIDLSAGSVNINFSN